MDRRGSEDSAFDPMQMARVPARLSGAECIAKNLQGEETAGTRRQQIPSGRVSELIEINVQVFGTFP
jgi:hypothetical protein